MLSVSILQNTWRRGAGPALALMVLLLAGIVNADAAPRRGEQITGCSRFGHGCISGVVRPGRFDNEVRLPGGTWIGCARDCRDTLRAETVDFWETHMPGGGDNSRKK